MKKIVSPLLFLFIVLFTFHNTKSRDYQLGTQLEPKEYDRLLDAFCQPLQFTRSGISHFLQNIFSRREYSEDFLPHNFCHFLQFLEHGRQTSQNRIYMQSTIRLFTNKIKASRYITAYAFSDMLQKLPHLLHDHFVPQHIFSFETLKETFKKILYSMFLSKFSFFKEDPDAFFDDLSDELVHVIENNDVTQEAVSREQLKQILIRFLEVNLVKLIWSPLDQEHVWDSVKTISYQLTELMNHNIIDQDELDDLFKSLLESFCHFLDLTGSELSLEVINKIKEDIASGELLFFELEEQEQFIETKYERLLNALRETEAKVHARIYGIVTEVMVY